jgi:1-phosphatidylinositol-4-phosphate 5-kinase
MLPRYYDHVKKYENTLVMRVLGLHRVKPVGGRKVCYDVDLAIIVLFSMLYMTGGRLAHHLSPFALFLKVRFIVMANVLATDIRIHKRFDLKGSSHGRSTGKAETDEDVTLKDLDLDYVFRLEQQWRDAVCRYTTRLCLSSLFRVFRGFVGMESLYFVLLLQSSAV